MDNPDRAIRPEVAEFWQRACAAVPGIAHDWPFDVWHFGDSEELARSLAELVLEGPKRATTGLLAQFNEATPLPRVGGLSIVTDYAGSPLMLLRTTETEIVPFQDVTQRFAGIEGEGDGSLDYWRDAHLRYFSRACGRDGYAFSPEMHVVCEVFELLFPRRD